MSKKKLAKHAFNTLVYLFAAIGFLLVVGYFAVKYGLTNTSGIIDTQREAFLHGAGTVSVPLSDIDPALPWSATEEWGVLDAAIRKDAPVIRRAAADSGVSARLIVANLVAEQLRLFFSYREGYKQFFYPLKILGAQTQFSWGVMGMKEDTAIKVEEYLKDPASPYYPGFWYAHRLDYPADTADVKQARFARMTAENDHYYSYLYTGLFLKEVETAWRSAGFPIDHKPDVLSTLFNIGFAHSTPNANPQVGGAEIDLNGNSYSFGGLAGDFYNSNLLTDIFPR